MSKKDEKIAQLDKTVHQYEDYVDLMNDDFKRIRACPGATDEIKGLCDRAIMNTKQHVPVIEQRDQAIRELEELKANFPAHYCPECDMDTNLGDEDGCCIACGTELIPPATGRERHQLL
jgi:hypothetical protein